MSRRERDSGRMTVGPGRSPGVGRGPVKVHPRAPEPPPQTLAEALNDAVEAVVVGGLMRPSLVGTARTAARQVVLRHNIKDARIDASLDRRRNGIAMTVVLPKSPHRVAQVVLRVGVAGLG